MKWTLTILLIMISTFSLASALPEITYTHSSSTTCENGKCTTTLYSGTEYAKNNKGQWVQWERAESLKNNGFTIEYIEDDGTHKIEVIDFNATSIQVKLDLKGITLFPYSTDLKVLDITNSASKADFKTGAVELIKTKEDFSLFKQSVTYTLPFGANKVVEFGKNSTTIVLQTANAENLKDAHVSVNQPTTNFGSETGFVTSKSWDSGTDFNTIITFNLTNVLPQYATLESANFSAYLWTNGLDADTEGYNISMHLVYDDFIWTESGITWNKRPINNATQTMYNESREDDLYFFGGVGEPTLWQYWDINNINYLNNRTQVTLYLIGHDSFGTPAFDGLSYYSKEYETVETRRPKFTMVYSVPFDVIDDVWVDSANADQNKQSNPSTLTAGTSGTSNASILIKFNTSEVTTASEIINATMSIYLVTNNLDADSEGYNLSLYYVYPSFTWTEETLNWTARPTAGQFNPTPYGTYRFFGGAGEPSGWIDFNMTQMITDNKGNDTMTVWLQPNTKFGNPDYTTDTIVFIDKESSAYQKPRIYYNEQPPAPPGATNCTAYSTGNYTIDCTTNCHVNNTINLGGNSVISTGAGTIYFDETISNVKSWIGSSGCKWIFNKAGGLWG
jgi:hypothetical protein